MHTISILGCNSLDSARCHVWTKQHAKHILHNWEIRLHRGCDAASLEISFNPVDFYFNMKIRSPLNFHISIYFLVFSQSIKAFVVERKCEQIMTKWNPTVNHNWLKQFSAAWIIVDIYFPPSIITNFPLIHRNFEFDK